MTGGINARYVKTQLPEQQQQGAQTNATQTPKEAAYAQRAGTVSGEQGSQNPKATQDYIGDKAFSIWNIYAEQDKNQNEYLTKEESTKISEWKGKENGSEIDSRSRLNKVISDVMNGFEKLNKYNENDVNQIQNSTFSKMSAGFIGGIAEKSMEVLNSFKGLFVGSEEFIHFIDPGEDEKDVSKLGEGAIAKQQELTQKANKGIDSVIETFDNSFGEKLNSILEAAQKEARNQIETEMKALDNSAEQSEYQKVGKRQVNDQQIDVYKKDGKHYIKNNDQFEEVFLVNDNGKNKYV